LSGTVKVSCVSDNPLDLAVIEAKAVVSGSNMNKSVHNHIFGQPKT
jgi:hypothetical protein